MVSITTTSIFVDAGYRLYDNIDFISKQYDDLNFFLIRNSDGEYLSSHEDMTHVDFFYIDDVSENELFSLDNCKIVSFYKKYVVYDPDNDCLWQSENDSNSLRFYDPIEKPSQNIIISMLNRWFGKNESCSRPIM